MNNLIIKIDELIFVSLHNFIISSAKSKGVLEQNMM